MNASVNSPALPSVPNGRPINRRTQIRHTCSLVGEVEILERGANCKWPVRGLDLSQGGIGLLLERRFEPGTMLGLLVHGADPMRPFTAVVRVIRVEARPGDQWLLGCQFPRNLDFEELAAVADLSGRAVGNSSRYFLLNKKKQLALRMLRDRLKSLCEPGKP